MPAWRMHACRVDSAFPGVFKVTLTPACKSQLDNMPFDSVVVLTNRKLAANELQAAAAQVCVCGGGGLVTIGG